MSIKTLRQIEGIVYDHGPQHIELELECGMYIIASLSDKQHDKLYSDFGEHSKGNYELMRLEPEATVFGVFEEGRAHGSRDLMPRLIWTGSSKDIEFLREQFGPFDIDEGPTQKGIGALVESLRQRRQATSQ